MVQMSNHRRVYAIGDIVAGLVILGACDSGLVSHDSSLMTHDSGLVSHDNFYSYGTDHFVLCSKGFDHKEDVSVDVAALLDRAKSDGTTLHLYAHRPGYTVAISALESLLAAAAEREMELVTYDVLTTSARPGSLALSFDDLYIESWTALRPTLARYGARVTFFISSFAQLSDDEHAQIARLASDGHDIEFHSVNHLNAVDYVSAHAMDRYLADEILPGLEAMRRAGYAPTVFAYPFGAHNDAIDAALMPYFHNVRAIHDTCPY